LHCISRRRCTKEEKSERSAPINKKHGAACSATMEVTHHTSTEVDGKDGESVMKDDGRKEDSPLRLRIFDQIRIVAARTRRVSFIRQPSFDFKPRDERRLVASASVARDADQL
jgi:hypothetical protein